MNYNNIIIVLILIVIPLIILILCYRKYVHNYCQNDMKCLKEKLIFNLNKLSNSNKINTNTNTNNSNNIINKNSEDNIEGFFGGLNSWFSGSAPTNMPVSAGSFKNENLPVLEKKINDKMNFSKTFPPPQASDDFKDSNNLELLETIGSKPLINKNNINDINNINKTDTIPINNNINNINKTDIIPINNNALTNSIKKISDVKKEIPVIPPPPEIKNPDIQSLLGMCQFFNDKCPDTHTPLGNFSIQGLGSNSILSCGNVENIKAAHAIAKIKNNSIYEIHITDPGQGFNSKNPPKITVEGGKGHGATAEAVIDDDGILKLIKIINPGYNYTETPNVLIETPLMNSSCHLCCSKGT